MDKEKLRESLHRLIDNLEDETLLQRLKNALIILTDYASNDLTQKQSDRLNESLHQLSIGQWKSHDEVRKIVFDRLMNRN
jgi:hypothetical protein